MRNNTMIVVAMITVASFSQVAADNMVQITWMLILLCIAQSHTTQAAPRRPVPRHARR